MIKFKSINEAALNARLPQQLLANGKRVGNEWQFINTKRGDQHLGSASINLTTGAWADFAINEKGGDFISLVAYWFDVNQVQAADMIADYLGFNKEDIK